MDFSTKIYINSRVNNFRVNKMLVENIAVPIIQFRRTNRQEKLLQELWMRTNFV